MVVFPFPVLNTAIIWKKILSAVVPFHAPPHYWQHQVGISKDNSYKLSQSVTEKLMKDP
jgi:hypothetical protein